MGVPPVLDGIDDRAPAVVAEPLGEAGRDREAQRWARERVGERNLHRCKDQDQRQYADSYWVAAGPGTPRPAPQPATPLAVAHVCAMASPGWPAGSDSVALRHACWIPPRAVASLGRAPDTRRFTSRRYAGVTGPMRPSLTWLRPRFASRPLGRHPRQHAKTRCVAGRGWGPSFPDLCRIFSCSTVSRPSIRARPPAPKPAIRRQLTGGSRHLRRLFAQADVQ